MALLVMKFGGTSVADIKCIKNVAAHVKREADAGNHCAVVVSAMSGQTNRLVEWVNEASPDYDEREYDTIVSSGEQVTSGLLALALQAVGVKARSWQGWQIPIQTSEAHGSARISNINGDNLRSAMESGQVAVIAGFQGVTGQGRISTLGRGGSDTSAVALAAAIGADRCDIYTDVDGVYTTDPRIVKKATRLDKISYEEMLEMASQGAKVLQTRSVEMGMKHNVRLLVRSSFDDPKASPAAGTGRQSEVGTLVCNEDEIMEKHVVNGITCNRDEAKIMLTNVADKPGVAGKVFGSLADAGVNVDMIVQNLSEDGKYTDIAFTVPASEYDKAMNVLETSKEVLGYKSLRGSKDVVKISAIGVGMRSHAGVAAQMFAAMAQKGINIQAITTSEIKISVLIDPAYSELAVRTLHTLFGLDEE